MGKLTARQVETLEKPGRHSDGNNLYLAITSAKAKSWVFLFKFQGKQREMGLGSLSSTSLAEARVKALAAMKQLKSGSDPLIARQAAAKAQTTNVTFGQFADDYLKAHEAKFRNAKHAAQWRATLGPGYCNAIRKLPINEVGTEAVLKVLRPIWQKVPETAARIRGRIENVLDAAKAQGLYQGDNPARWKGHLKSVLPARQRLSRGHHAALPYDELPSLMRGLRVAANRSSAAVALEFTILNASRTGETLSATWAEIDRGKAVWVIPAVRMKSGIEHRVPLSTRSLEILEELARHGTNPGNYVFPGFKLGRPLSNMAMSMALKQVSNRHCTVHGFRSSFRDWAAEETAFPHELCEMALAHTIPNAAERAYRRGDLFEKRRALMTAWQQYCEGASGARIIRLNR